MTLRRSGGDSYQLLGIPPVHPHIEPNSAGSLNQATLELHNKQLTGSCGDLPSAMTSI